jgi:hypothetical protein
VRARFLALLADASKAIVQRIIPGALSAQRSSRFLSLFATDGVLISLGELSLQIMNDG